MLPADGTISQAIAAHGEEAIHEAWRKALERRDQDPDGAITSARTLLEEVGKYLITAAGGTYGEKDDLPRLYRTTAGLLNLAPSQHTADVFKMILGGCHSVVEGLGSLRNRLGDAHGRGKQARASPRHTALAVNLSGSVAMFLL